MTFSGIQPRCLINVGCIVACMIGLASCLNLAITPDLIKSNTERLTLTCQTDGAAYESRKVTDIEIRKSDQVIAKVNYKNEIQLGNLYTRNMEARGHIEREAHKSFLTLTIHKPQRSDAVKYTCLVKYMDGEMAKKTDTAIASAHYDEAKWRVDLYTGTEKEAASNAYVYIQIVGDKGKSEKMDLDDTSDNFETNKVDHIQLTTPLIGTPKEIILWHEDHVDHPISWHLMKVDLVELYSDGEGETYNFFCDCWFRSGGSDTTNKTLTVLDTNWQVKVTTGDLSHAGTNQRVTLTVFGEKGNTRPLELDKEENNFERGKTDVFMLKTVDVGTPTKIKVEVAPVGHMNRQNEWYMDKVVLVNENGARTYNFGCNCWFGNTKGDPETKQIQITI